MTEEQWLQARTYAEHSGLTAEQVVEACRASGRGLPSLADVEHETEAGGTDERSAPRCVRTASPYKRGV